MKMHKLEVYVMDHEGYGPDSYKIAIENMRDLSMQVKAVETAEIGEWHDKHELNMTDTPVERFRAYMAGASMTKAAFELAYRKYCEDGGHSYDAWGIAAAWKRYQTNPADYTFITGAQS